MRIKPTLRHLPHDVLQGKIAMISKFTDDPGRELTVVYAKDNTLTGGKHTPERCLEAAFRFLLDREPKESILSRFDVTVISRYFPEFERELPRYLAQS
jgi:hypothetical protein